MTPVLTGRGTLDGNDEHKTIHDQKTKHNAGLSKHETVPRQDLIFQTSNAGKHIGPEHL